MNIERTAPNLRAPSRNDNSGDKMQALEQRKKQLTQELKRVKEASKGGKIPQEEAEKKMKELSDQIKEIEEQIITLQKQKQSPANQPEKVDQTDPSNKLEKNNSAKNPLAKSAENRKFDRYIKEEDSPEKADNTYRVENEDGKQVVKFNMVE